MGAATTPKKSKGHHHVVRRNTRYAACSAGNLKHATFRPYCARAAAALAAATRSRNLKYLAIDVPSFSNTQIPLFIFLAIFAPGWDFEKDRLMRLIVGVWQHGAPRVGTRHPAATREMRRHWRESSANNNGYIRTASALNVVTGRSRVLTSDPGAISRDTAAGSGGSWGRQVEKSTQCKNMTKCSE